MKKNKKYVLAVDIDDNPIKKIEKLKSHKKPILHRAFSVFLFDENKMLIQKRSKNKYHSAMLWTNSCCSHPTTNNIKQEANLRLKEELGIQEEVKLTKIFKSIYFAKINNLFEYELDHVLVGCYNGKIKLNKEEASTYCWIEIEKLEKLLVSCPLKFSSWFLNLAPNVIKYYKNKKHC